MSLATKKFIKPATFDSDSFVAAPSQPAQAPSKFEGLKAALAEGC
jgi:hypothetical protein